MQSPSEFRRSGARLDLGLVPLVYGMIAMLLIAVGIREIAASANPGARSAVLFWFFFTLTSIPFSIYLLRWKAAREQSSVRWLHTLSAVVQAIPFGCATHFFSGAMSGTELHAMLSMLVLATMSALAIHGIHFGRVAVFFVISWLPFAFVLTTTSAEVGVVLIGLLVLSPLVIALLAAAVNVWFRSLYDHLEQAKAAETQMVRTQGVAREKAHAEQNLFLLTANHDVRQPLQAVAIYSNWLATKLKGGDQEVLDIATRLDISVKLLGNVIDETLRFAKIASGEEATKLTVFDPDVVGKKLHQEFVGLAKQKGIGLRVRRFPKPLYSDVAIVEHILSNLVGNAIRYTNKGGVLIAFRLRAGRCSIEVWDTGVGIRQDEQPRVFDAFYQAGNHSESQRGTRVGYGIGLKIVQALCEKIGADVVLRSRPGRGTCVSFEVPISTGASELQTPVTVGFEQPDLRGATIAVLEDDREIREGLSGMLSHAGAVIIAADNISDLWRALSAVDGLDIIIADLHVGSEIGIDAIEMANRRFPRAVSIVMTGDASAKAMRDLRRSGYRTILKPVDPQELLLMISDSLLNKGDVE